MTDSTLARTHYLTVAEVAEDLRVARMTVYRLINAGTLRALRLGPRTYRIPTDSYAAYKRRLDTDATDRQQRATGTAPIPGQMILHPLTVTVLPAATDGIAAL